MSITRCKREHTYQQMMHWLSHIQDEQANGFHRYDEYAARILCELRGIRAPKKSLRWTDFLVKFVFRRPGAVMKPKQQEPAVTKAYLHAAMGIIDEKREQLRHGIGTTGPSG